MFLAKLYACLNSDSHELQKKKLYKIQEKLFRIKDTMDIQITGDETEKKDQHT
jgi:uncharacterized protein YxjI